MLQPCRFPPTVLARSSQESPNSTRICSLKAMISHRTRDSEFRKLTHNFCETFEIYVHNMLSMNHTV